MNRVLISSILFWLASCGTSYAIDTYFPGDGPPSSADVETEPPHYYPPQQAQPNSEDELYDNPAEPINPKETNANQSP